MKPKDFKGQNVIFAKDQLEYQPLPAQVFPDGTVITCWELTEQELMDITKNKCFYLQQLTFNQPLQPILPLVNLEDGIDLTL